MCKFMWAVIHTSLTSHDPYDQNVGLLPYMDLVCSWVIFVSHSVTSSWFSLQCHFRNHPLECHPPLHEMCYHTECIVSLGTSEDFWKVQMKTATIVQHNGFNSLMASSTTGGRFDVEMDKSISNMRSAVFMAEYGPLQYHIGHFITYQLDRLLGVS